MSVLNLKLLVPIADGVASAKYTSRFYIEWDNTRNGAFDYA